MDQVFDALSAELPYDRCSNDINLSIQSYKDGKDKGLVGGTSDNLDKDSAENRFYERLKSDIDKIHGTNDNFDVETNGTQVGRFLFNNCNDFVEKASEAFNDSVDDDSSLSAIAGVVSGCAKTTMSRCEALIKSLTDLNKTLNKMEFTNSEIEISDSLKNNKTKLKDIFVNIDKENRVVKSIYIPKDINDIGEFLRDSLIATSTIDKKYSLRYVERYNALKDIVKEMSNSTTVAQKYLNDKKEPFKDLLSSRSKILENFNNIIRLSDNKDPFVFRKQSYKADLNVFIVKPVKLNYPEYGITLLDYLSVDKEEKIYDTKKESIIFTSIRGSDTTKRIKDKLYASDIIGSGKIDLKSSEYRDIDLLKMSGDMTVGEFYTQVEKHLTNISDKDELKKSALKCSDNTIESFKFIKSVATRLSTLASANYTNISQSEMYVVKMLIHFSCEALLDTMSTVECMNACNMIDNVRKLTLLNLTNSLIKCFDSNIRSSLGE